MRSETKHNIVDPVLSTTLSCHMFRFVQHLGHQRLLLGRLAEDVAFLFLVDQAVKFPDARFSVLRRVALHVSLTTSRPLAHAE